VEKIIGYKQNEKGLLGPIYEDLGEAKLSTCHRETTRRQGEIAYLVSKIENMSSKNSKKYIAKVCKSQKEKYGADGKELARLRKRLIGEGWNRERQGEKLLVSNG